MAPNLILSNVMVIFDRKASCEIACPFYSCKYMTKLSSIKQANLFALPKFNTYNFERHINTQHVNKKRKNDGEKKTPLKRLATDTTLGTFYCDISPNRHDNTDSSKYFACSTPLRQKSSTDQPELMTPKTAEILMLKKELSDANNKINVLKNIHPTTYASASTSSLRLSMTPRSVRLEKLSCDLLVTEKITGELHEENIMLRHKFMDASGKIRTFCRIKPELSGNCFNWQRSKDGENIQICMKNE